MARSRKVEEQVALSAALSAFRECGFKGLGTRELEERTGLTRFMLQTEYGGKKALLLRVLDIYLDDFEAWFTTTVAKGGLPTLAQFLRGRADDAQMLEAARFGCLMLNILTEFGDTDSDVGERSRRYFSLIRSGFVGALETAKSRGEARADIDIDTSADLLLSGLLGLNAYIRGHSANAAGAPLAEALAQYVEGLSSA